MRSQKLLVVNDVGQHPDLRMSYLVQMRVRSLLCAPLMHHSKVKGLIYLENNLARGTFGEDRVNAVMLLAAQAAIALENARLYAHLEEVVTLRTQELQRAHARLIQLERASTEMQMAGGFAHEMRNALGAAMYPLDAIYNPGGDVSTGNTLSEATVQGFDAMATVLAEGHDPQALHIIIEKMRENQTLLEDMMAIVREGLKRGLRITDEILNYAHVGHLIVGDDASAFERVAQGVLEEFRERFADHHIAVETEVQDGLSVPMKDEHLYTILRNLVANSLDAMTASEARSQQCRLLVGAQEHHGQIVISIGDSGVGMPAAVQARIFQPFFSTKGTRGTGLGLGLCKKLTQAYGGDLTFTSEEKRGTTFQVSIPSSTARPKPEPHME